MTQLQDLGADPLCSIVAFAAGAEIVALLKTTRRVRTTLVGPVARRHFQALSIARWGESCRCLYAVSNLKPDARDSSGSDEPPPQVHSSGTSGGSSSETVIVTGSSSSSSSAEAAIVTETGSSSNSDIGGSESTTTPAVNTTISSGSCDGGASGIRNQIGVAVHDSAGETGADWLAFYLRRIGHRAAWPSPLDLLQEHYSEDAYRLLACCILCSRTSGGDTVKDAVEAFFKACPTPTSVLSVDQEELRKTLLPLGLNREIIVKRFAEGFLRSAWHDPSELHGCGRFASDSWQIFCLGVYRPGDQVVAAAVLPVDAQAISAGDKDGTGSAKKKKSRAGDSRRGALDRNLAAYCRSAQRRGSSSPALSPGGGTAEGARGEGGRGVDALCGVARTREPAGDAAGASVPSKKKRKTRTAGVSALSKDGSSKTSGRKGRRAPADRSSSARGSVKSARGGGRRQPRRGVRKPGGDDLTGAVAVGSASSRDERASRRRQAMAGGMCS